MKPARIAYVTCPRCRALNEHGMAECFLCEMPLAGLPADVLPVKARLKFRLSTLMLLIALAAAFLGLCRAFPVVAAMMFLPIACALGLTIAWSCQRYGRTPSTWQCVCAFSLILGIELALMASSAIAFLTTCAAVLSLSPVAGSVLQDGSIAAGLGLIAAIVVPIALIASVRVRGTKFHNKPPSGRRD
jgi:hypothetical protein